METRQGKLIARESDGCVEICNERILARFDLRDGGYSQEFYASDCKGKFHLVLSSLHKNLIPSSEHRACSSPMIAGERPHLFAVCRESLRMVYSSVEIVRHDDRFIIARLSGSAQGHLLKCWVIIEDGSNAAHIIASDDLGQDHLVEYLMSSYAFLPYGYELGVGEKFEYTWVPNLRPQDDHVIGDCAFNSPAIIVQHRQLSATMIPDLQILSKNRQMPTALDLDFNNGLLPAPLLSYGFCNYEITPDGRYCRHDMTMAKRLSNTRLVYGYHLILNADCSIESTHREAANFIWQRYRSKAQQTLTFSEQYTDNNLLQTVHRLNSAILSSPQNNGLFPTKFNANKGEWTGCRVKVKDAYYNTVECSSMLSRLLRSDQEDPRIIEYCRNYADYLVSSRMRSGAIPSWYTKELLPLSALRSSAQTAASVIFLAKLARITGDVKYSQAAEKSAKFVYEHIQHYDAFKDYTLINPFDENLIELKDSHSEIHSHGAYSMLWVAQMCLELYILTNNSHYLDRGQLILDMLCMFQSVWIKPWLKNHNYLGQCSLGNVNPNFNAELSAEFALCAMDYGAETGIREYLERGELALSSALNDPAASSQSRARISATKSTIESCYGDAFVHQKLLR